MGGVVGRAQRRAWSAQVVPVVLALLGWAPGAASLVWAGPPRGPGVAAMPAADLAAVQEESASAPASHPEGKKSFTLEEIFGSQERVNFSGSYATGLSWLEESARPGTGVPRLLHRRDGVLYSVDALTDEAEPAYDLDACRTALAAREDFDGQAAERIARGLREFSPDRSAALFTHNGWRYVYHFATRRVTRLFEESGTREAAFSPKTGFVSFVRDNDLYVVGPEGGGPRRLTFDGSPTRLNGVLDWVYQEEVYGRGRWRAYWWSPDERYIAFLQLDESQVPQYTIVHYGSRPPKVEQQHYPYAGEPNPAVRLGVVTPAGGRIVWASLRGYPSDILIVRVGWSPDGKVIFQVQDREQTWLDLNEADPQTGSCRTLLRERSPAWVNVLDEPHWLSDGSFLWRSERDGWAHLYHYSRDGGLIRRLTGGDWEVRELHGVDERRGWVYFSGTRDTPLASHAYRVLLTGGTVQRLTEPGYSHSVSFSPDFEYFIDTFSNLHTPPKVYLRRSDGACVRVISENDVRELEKYELGRAEFLRIPARDGYLLNALLVLPPDYQPGRRYPVWCPVYGGPQSPTVRDAWRGAGFAYDQMLAQHGCIVWRCDPRSASGQGAVSAWQAYRRLGAAELADIEDGVRWLIEQGYADPQRIGISGGSYGGYLVCYALTHSTMFKVGVAAFPVTDWRGYDSIYTERYMRTPQNNPQGYQLSSALAAADRLHGRLLIYHGMVDDNVHVLNVMQFVERLQAARRDFRLMLYPRDGHGIGHGSRHEREMTHAFLMEEL